MEESNKIKTVSKYEVVKKYILSLIDSKQLVPGDKIPMEQDLAKHFGVSITTTRKALSDLVNDGIVYRVRKRGTIVSATASGKEEQKPKMTSFILPLNNRTDNNLLQFVLSAQTYLSKHGYPMLIEATYDNIDLENASIEKAVESNLSGVLIYPSYPAKNTSYFLKLKENNIPFVLLDRFPDDLPVSAVTCNNMSGSFQATEHLIKIGHKKLAFIPYIYTNQAEQIRYKGYKLALRTYGICTQENELNIYTLNQKEDICTKIKEGNITALVCATDYCALELLEYFNAHNIHVPEDVSIVGFDGQKATQYVSPAITTIIQPYAEMGEKAAEFLVDMMETGCQNPRQYLVPVSLDVRKSTAAPKSYGK